MVFQFDTGAIISRFWCVTGEKLKRYWCDTDVSWSNNLPLALLYSLGVHKLVLKIDKIDDEAIIYIFMTVSKKPDTVYG